MMIRCLLFIGILAYPSIALAQIDELYSWESTQTGEQFGIALSISGDGNHDGRVDLAVGASTNDEAGDNAGKVSIFFGRATPLDTPDIELFGDPGSFFGSAVSWVEDVNNDGYDDLLVGAYRQSSEGTNAGRAYLFLGGEPMSVDPALVLIGPGAGSYFGRAVAGVGDLNGDNRGDFAVGAPRTSQGQVYVYYGAESVDNVPDLIITGDYEDGHFGSSIAGVGNVDGLAGNDLLVGAPRVTVEHLWQGEISLFSGGPGLDAVADWSLRGPEAGDQYGHAVAAAGDVNGDGHADFITGAPYVNVGTVIDAGEARLFYGGPALDTNADFILTGELEEDRLGFSVAGAGDMTGSGYSHILVGVPGRDNAGVDSGLVVMSPGGDPPSPGELIELTGEHHDDQFGYALAGVAPSPAGTFTGAERPDMCIGAWGYDPGGKCYLYGQPGSGSAVGPFDPDAAMRATAFHIAAEPNPGRAFSIQLTLPSSLSNRGHHLSILNSDGRLVRQLSFQPSVGDTRRFLSWNGADQSGRALPSGVYYLTIQGSGSDASGSSHRVVLVR